MALPAGCVHPERVVGGSSWGVRVRIVGGREQLLSPTGTDSRRDAAGDAVIEQLAVGAGRVIAVLRLPLFVLVAMIGLLVPRSDTRPTVFLTVWIVVMVWSVAVAWWMFRQPVPRWASWLTTTVDLSALIALAATSAGATSYLGPVFYLYPIAVAFQFRPRLTATVGFLIAGAYVFSWLPRLGRYGGPSVPVVVWLSSGLLLWLASASTALTVFLVRQARDVAALLRQQVQLTAGTLAVAERERTRLAEELHDGPLQNVIAVRRNLEELADTAEDLELVRQSSMLLRDTAQELRGAVAVLHPQVLAELGLSAALAELASSVERRTHLAVHTRLADIGHVANEDLVYGTARELLANAVQHSGADQMWLELQATPAVLRLLVIDDGRGFDPRDIADRVAHGHIGLASRSARVRDLGGTMRFESREPSGTVAVVELPLTGVDAAVPARRGPRRSS